MIVQSVWEEARQMLAEHSLAKGSPLTAACFTFGCQMNERDSEKLRGILLEIGFQLQDDEEADLVLLNTCTVRENANRKIWGRLAHLRKMKQDTPGKIIGLCGCMMQDPQVLAEVQEKYPFVNFVCGTHTLDRLPSLIARSLHEPERQWIEILPDTEEMEETLPTRRTYAFKSGINIMYGCNNFCSYCIVPFVRGREKSRKPEEVIHEIQSLQKDGVREVMLLGQNVNSYGKTLSHPISFAELLHKVASVPGIDRIRFMTSHPKDLSDDLIRTMAELPSVCPHLHLPLQSGSNRILQKMNRHYTREHYRQLVEKLRALMPDLSLTTDILIGFPGETEEDFEDTYQLVNEVRFDSAFTFLYSRRNGTPAAADPEQIPEDVMHQRFDRLLDLVQTIGKEQGARFTGRTMEVLVEKQNSQDPSLVTGRLANNMLVHFSGDRSMIGHIVPVHLDECRGFYFLGSR